VPLALTVADAGAEWVILQPPPVHGLKKADLIRFFATVAATVSKTVVCNWRPSSWVLVCRPAA
jgi:dihydrodipicolinate synthase/N-acetylneuraminate lyase